MKLRCARIFLLYAANSPAVSVQNVSTDSPCSQMNPPSMVRIPKDISMTANIAAAQILPTMRWSLPPFVRRIRFTTPKISE